MRLTNRLFGLAALLAAALLGASGCSGGSKEKKADEKKDGDKKSSDKDAHPEKGPHGGALAEWGKEEYHAEFKQDTAKKQVTVFVLDGSAKKAAPIDAKALTLTLKGEKPPVQVTL